MKKSYNQELQVIERIASHSEILRLALNQFRREWEPKNPPAYLVVAEYAQLLIELNSNDFAIFSQILRDVELFLASGGEAADLVSVGLLEALLGRASTGTFDFSKIINFLGPKSLEFCRAWDDYTGCSITKDALRKMNPGTGI
jgi:hypothetical protein